MSLFDTKKKHISEFERNLAPIISEYIPEFQNLVTNSTIDSIHCMAHNKSLTLVSAFDPVFYKSHIGDDSVVANKITGIFLKNRSTKEYEQIEILLLNGGIQNIMVNSANHFHKNYDLAAIKIENFNSELLPGHDSETGMAHEILGELTQDQLNLLQLSSSLEIELNEKYFTVLDMENGNYIAVNDQGHFCRLIHDHSEPAKIIASNSEEFFKFYKGDKNSLEQYFV